ncbi:acyl-CoA N-acyltransferase [Dichotomocladium elegans]|nr:acyl-CoA N-acyltransferase [Dichotomocladium elegans]
MVRIERATLTSVNLEQLVALFQQLSSAATSETVTNALASSQNQVLVAYNEEGGLIGAAIVAMTPCASGTRVHIEDVIVDAECRGQGVGTMLLQQAIRTASGDDDGFRARTIDLTSRPEREAANRLYQHLGFEHRETNVYRYTPKYS